MTPNPTNPEIRGVKTPPFLLGATLLFWGWQSDFLAVGAILAVALEGARWIHSRWDLSDEDFHRVWNFCTLLVLAAGIFAFGNNVDLGGFNGLFHGPTVATGTQIALSGERTANALLRWLPMLLFPFVAAQAFSTVESAPLTAVSLILRRRQRKDIKAGRPVRPIPRLNVFYAYFMICLFAASIHANRGDSTFFWGLCILLGWALWPMRSRRFGMAVWAAAFGLAVVLGHLTQNGLIELEQSLNGASARLLARLWQPRADPTQRATALGQIGRLKLSPELSSGSRRKAGHRRRLI